VSAGAYDGAYAGRVQRRRGGAQPVRLRGRAVGGGRGQRAHVPLAAGQGLRPGPPQRHTARRRGQGGVEGPPAAAALAARGRGRAGAGLAGAKLMRERVHERWTSRE